MPVYFDKKRKTFYYKCSVKNHQYLKRGFLSYEDAKNDEASFITSNLDVKQRVEIPVFNELYKQFFVMYKETVKLSTYVDAQKKCGFLIKGHIPNVRVDKINNADLYAWRKNLMKYSRSSIDKGYLYLGQMFEFCQNYYGYDFKPFKLLPPIKDYSIHKDLQPKEQYVPFEDFQKFMSVIDDKKYYLLFLVAYITGMRISEIRGLTKEGYHDGCIYVFQQANCRLRVGKSVLTSPKSKDSNRVIPLPEFLIKMMDEYLAGRKNAVGSFIFPSSDKPLEPVGETTIKNHMKEYCKKSGVKHFKFHSLRHTEATALVDSGFDKKIVAGYLGHSSDKVTEKYYLHNDQSNKEKISELLDQKFKTIFSKTL